MSRRTRRGESWSERRRGGQENPRGFDKPDPMDSSDPYAPEDDDHHRDSGDGDEFGSAEY